MVYPSPLFSRASSGNLSEVEYVGSLLTLDSSNQAEINRRFEKAKRAWMAMGKFWSSNVNEKFKIVCYRCLVLNALLSGLEAFALGDTDLVKLEVLQMRFLRKIMCGGACLKTLKRTQDGREYVQFQALKNDRVREILKIATLESELRARRVKWLQHLIKWPEAGAPTLHVLESRFLWESQEQIAANGKLTAATNPWTKQFFLDLKVAASVHSDFREQFQQFGWWSIYRHAFQRVRASKVSARETLPSLGHQREFP